MLPVESTNVDSLEQQKIPYPFEDLNDISSIVQSPACPNIDIAISALIDLRYINTAYCT